MLNTVSGLLGGGVSIPTSPVAGYMTWLDAADTSTITQSGGLVSQWTDKSANAYTFTQSTSSYKPSTGVDTQNGKNVLTYGTNDNLTSTAATSVWKFLNASTSTIFMAFKQTNAAVDAFLWSTYLGSTSNTGAAAYHTSTGTLVHLITRGVGGAPAVSNSSVATLGTAFTYITIIGDPANATAANRSDERIKQGSAIKNNTLTAALNNVNPASPFQVGGYDTGSAEGINGTVGEVIIYDSILSAGNILLNQQYLANKWGV